MAALRLEAVNGRSVVMATVARAKVTRLAAMLADVLLAAAVPVARRLSRARAVEVATCRRGQRWRPLLDGEPRAARIQSPSRCSPSAKRFMAHTLITPWSVPTTVSEMFLA